MMRFIFPFPLLLVYAAAILSAAPTVSSFASQPPVAAAWRTRRSHGTVTATVETTTTLSMLPSSGLDDSAAAAATQSAMSMLHRHTQNSMIWIATIDSDIANIPDNEFASVFAGGIVVMFGGLLSALAVGFILEKRNLYATVVAESYAQGGDEDFWKSLSEEEKIKAQSILQQIKSNNEGGSPPSLPTSTSLSTTETVSPITPTTPIVPDSSKTEKKQIGMFSDYGEE